MVQHALRCLLLTVVAVLKKWRRVTRVIVAYPKVTWYLSEAHHHQKVPVLFIVGGRALVRSIGHPSSQESLQE